MRARYVIALLLAASGCKHVPKPGEAISDVCRIERNGETATASGYLQAPILFGCSEEECSLQLTSERKADYGMRLRIPLGTGPGTMTPLPPPKKTARPFTAERVTMELRDSSGRDVDVRDVVRVSGRVEVSQSPGMLHCAMRVTSFERL